MEACGKINLGLNVVSCRANGYHNLETVFLPIGLSDTIELMEVDEEVDDGCALEVDGLSINCSRENNLVLKAYQLLKKHYPLPSVKVHLTKRIPALSGLGGGSSDGAAMLKMLNERFALGLSDRQLERFALVLGADCPFFIKAEPAYAEGVGEKLYPLSWIKKQLLGMRLVVVKPPVNIPTSEAFSHITPHYPPINCLTAVMQPVDRWSDNLVNDFEEYAVGAYPLLKDIRTTLYRLGATYVSLTGSGSALYALFSQEIHLTRLYIKRLFPECITFVETIE